MTAPFAFPDGFLWGAATAGHQVEGNNVNSDVWLLEQLPGSIEKGQGDCLLKLAGELAFTSFR